MKKYKAKFKLIKDSLFSFEYKPGVVKTKDEWEKLIHCHIEDWPDFFEEIKEPLFTTFDGVEIFEMNSLIYEVYKTNYPNSIRLQDYERDESIDFSSDETYRYFSTLEAAKKWIDENKPIYSKNQILNAIEKSKKYYSETSYFIDKCWFKKELGL